MTSKGDLSKHLLIPVRGKKKKKNNSSTQSWLQKPLSLLELLTAAWMMAELLEHGGSKAAVSSKD